MNLPQTISDKVPLGKKSPYPTSYDASLLIPIERSSQRQAMALAKDLKFIGFDLWHIHELFWLNMRGKPLRAKLSFFIDATSKFLVESKSVKLYLHSLNHERFSSTNDLLSIIYRDIANSCQGDIKIVLGANNSIENYDKYICLDELDIDVIYHHPETNLLKHESHMVVQQKLMTNLFKSHCLCTGQPDLGSIYIDYEGKKIDEASLLAYLLSFRDHQGFSENVIEQIFGDLMICLSPKSLCIRGEFTTRGGIAINPYRTTKDNL